MQMDLDTIGYYARRFRTQYEGVDLSTPNPAHNTGHTHRNWLNANIPHKYVMVWNDYSISYNFSKKWWDLFYQPRDVERKFISGEHRHIFDAFDAAYEHKAAKNKQLLKHSQVQ